jgi:hypothetical protein
MAVKAQLHVKLSAKDAASLRKIARAEQRSLSDTVRHLVRRAAAALKVA